MSKIDNAIVELIVLNMMQHNIHTISINSNNDKVRLYSNNEGNWSSEDERNIAVTRQEIITKIRISTS